MKMPKEFAFTLLDNLCDLATYAIGSKPETPEELNEMLDYAQDIFFRLCNEWEAVIGEEWEIADN